MVTIMPCGCSHKYQDEKYGKGQRVHNDAKRITTSVVAIRCTVCGNTKTRNG